MLLLSTTGFGAFIISMLVRQGINVYYNCSEIDRYKEIIPPKKPVYENLKEIFGADFGPGWFIPLI